MSLKLFFFCCVCNKEIKGVGECQRHWKSGKHKDKAVSLSSFPFSRYFNTVTWHAGLGGGYGGKKNLEKSLLGLGGLGGQKFLFWWWGVIT